LIELSRTETTGAQSDTKRTLVAFRVVP